MEIFKTHKELSDFIVNTINKEYNLELKTVDSFSMSERIEKIIFKARYWRQPEYFWEIDPLDYESVIIYQDGREDENYVSCEKIDTDEGNITREEAINNIIKSWNAKEKN